jgi:hypothetical protein
MARRFTLLLTIPLLAVAACGGDDGGSAADWCDLATQIDSSFDEGDDFDFTDPEAVEQQLARSSDLLDGAVDAAPDEIKDDVEATVEGWKLLVAEFASADFDVMNVDVDKMDELSAAFDEASGRVEEFNETECGITTDDTTAGDTDDTDDTDDTVADEDTEGADATVPSSGSAPSDGTLRQVLINQFTSLGLTEDEATCIADKVDLTDPAMASGDPTAMLGLFEECGLDLARIAELGGG